MNPRTIKSLSFALLGLLLFFAVVILFRIYSDKEVPAQFIGALLGAIVTAAITMALLHGQSQAEETKERNVKVFEEKTKRYNEFLKKLWTVWQDRHVTLEELNDLMESVSQDIIIYTKEESTQKLLSSLTRIATHAGKIHTTEEEKQEVQKEVFEIINILSEEMNLGGRINKAIKDDLNKLDAKVRPFLTAKEYKKKLVEEVHGILERAALPVSFSKPYYEPWAGNEYLWVKIEGSPIELGVGPVSNLTGTEGRLIGMFVEFYSHREFQDYRDALRGFRKDFLRGIQWGISIVDFSSPESVSDWVKQYAESPDESPAAKVGAMLVQFVQQWRFDGRDIKSVIDECCGPKLPVTDHSNTIPS
jgi:hypothetical protein